MQKWYLYCDDAKTSIILLTHSHFHCGRMASMTAKQRYKVHRKEGKGITLSQHHLTSRNFEQSGEFSVPFKSNSN